MSKKVLSILYNEIKVDDLQFLHSIYTIQY